jgi:hypothetical protein
VPPLQVAGSLDGRDKWYEHVQYYMHDDKGLAIHEFDSCATTLRELNVKVTDASGEHIQTGEVQLWLRIFVRHG